MRILNLSRRDNIIKLFCISDLHLTQEDVVNVVDCQRFSPFLAQIREQVAAVNPDVIILTGDTVSPAQVRLLSPLAQRLFPDGLPVILTLGNHEFWGRTFEDTLEKLKAQISDNRNVFFLDLIGGVVLDGVNFVGGTLFFDGSMRIKESQRVDDWGGWQDWRITDIETRYLDINRYYVDMIKSKMRSGMSTVLCTHHVPHVRLNGHEPGHYSFYTGMKDLVRELPFNALFSNYLICGHTHRRVIGEIIPGFIGVNVGSDYGDFKFFTLDLH